MIKSQTVELISAADVSANIESDVIDLRFNLGVYIQASFTGSPSGSVVLQASNDQSNWSTLDTVSISGTTLLSINKPDIYAPYVRVIKASGGTGTMSVSLTLKGV